MQHTAVVLQKTQPVLKSSWSQVQINVEGKKYEQWHIPSWLQLYQDMITKHGCTGNMSVLVVHLQSLYHIRHILDLSS